MTAELMDQVHIESEMREAYLDYAMSVIVARALPDARDGLKPVHRRILYAMHELGMRAGTEFKKSARVVGEVLGKYHPHGDAAVYDTMVRLAQDFSMRSPLLEGQGNFGSIDGDGPAAMRYTEVRMAALGGEMMEDIDRETVPFVSNFDGTLQEPIILPGKIPNLLVNGTSGIAVGMATSIPPHNLGEICNALCFMLDHWQRLEELTIIDLMKYIRGPDFPTRGVVFRHADGANHDKGDSLRAAYESGRGKITLRGRWHEEPLGRARSSIVITELPYQVNKASLIERIVNLARDGRLNGLADLRDESDRSGLRLVLELTKDAEAEKLLTTLYRQTQFQDTYSIILLALDDGIPRLLSLKRALQIFLEHRLDVLQKRSRFELANAEQRAHILEGLLIALGKLDVVVDIIKRSRRADTAQLNLRKRLKISEEQARAILQLPLGRLVSMERRRTREEFQETLRRIRDLRNLLASEEEQRAVIRAELLEMKKKFPDKRRTQIEVGVASGSLADAENANATTWVTLSYRGKLGRIDRDPPPRPNTRNRDTTVIRLKVRTTRLAHIFTASGRCVAINPRDLPRIQQAHLGQGIAHAAREFQGERIIAMSGSAGDDEEAGYLLLATAGGLVKRIERSLLSHSRRDAYSIINLRADDELIAAFPHGEEDEIVLLSARGRLMRFAASEARVSGQAAGGVQAMRIVEAEGDRVVAALAAPAGSAPWLWFATADGAYGRLPLADFPKYRRGAQGVFVLRMQPGSADFRAAVLGEARDELLVISDSGRGRMVRLDKAEIRKRGDITPERLLPLRDQEQVERALRLTAR